MNIHFHIKYCVNVLSKDTACSAVSAITFLRCFRETIKIEFSTLQSKEGMCVSSRNKWAGVLLVKD